jgi:hypothetical protein
MTVKQLNIKSFQNTAVTFGSFPSGSVGWGFYFFISIFVCTKERANRNRNCKCVKPYIKNFGCF